MGAETNEKLDQIIENIELLGINSTSVCTQEYNNTASGKITIFDYTFTEARRIFVIALSYYILTPFDLNIYFQGTANGTVCASWKQQPFMLVIYQIDGTEGQTASLILQAYINAQHTSRCYLIK